MKIEMDVDDELVEKLRGEGYKIVGYGAPKVGQPIWTDYGQVLRAEESLTLYEFLLLEKIDKLTMTFICDDPDAIIKPKKGEYYTSHDGDNIFKYRENEGDCPRQIWRKV